MLKHLVNSGSVLVLEGKPANETPRMKVVIEVWDFHDPWRRLRSVTSAGSHWIRPCVLRGLSRRRDARYGLLWTATSREAVRAFPASVRGCYRAFESCSRGGPRPTRQALSPIDSSLVRPERQPAYPPDWMVHRSQNLVPFASVLPATVFAPVPEIM